MKNAGRTLPNLNVLFNVRSRQRMAGQPILNTPPADALLLRRQAGDLLCRMLADRETLDRRLSESGKCDPIRSITGASALERAITDARAMIARMDLLLGELDSGIHALSADQGRGGCELERPRPSVAAAQLNRQRSRGMLADRKLPVAATT
jgi:hypothetical protein